MGSWRAVLPAGRSSGTTPGEAPGTCRELREDGPVLVTLTLPQAEPEASMHSAPARAQLVEERMLSATCHREPASSPRGWASGPTDPSVSIWALQGRTLTKHA